MPPPAARQPARIWSQASLADSSILSPFTQLRRLLDGVAPGPFSPIELTIGEPRGAMPDFVLGRLTEAAALYGKYPPIRGTPELMGAIAAWLSRRYDLRGAVDQDREILPLNGSREGLFLACVPAVGRKRLSSRPAIAMCNPHYSAYLAGALAVGAEPVFLNATATTGFLPDLEDLEADRGLLDRLAALFICSPANPQGVVAGRDYLLKALDLARRYDFLLFLDECYSEIYTGQPPLGGLAVAAATPERFANLVVFNSLSKRSNLPGLRSAFCVGEVGFIDTYAEIRNLCAPQVPGPVQYASAAAWSDEAHVEMARAVYREKFAIADEVLGDRLGYRRPAGGFCLWLDMSQIGGGVQAAVTLWKSFAVKVIPGAFLAQAGRDGSNPGDSFVRVALVQDPAIVRQALERIVQVTA